MGLADRDYMRERRAAGYGQGRPIDRTSGHRIVGVAPRPLLGLFLAFCSIGIPAYRIFNNQDLLDLFQRDGRQIRFPDSGTVTVSPLATIPGPRGLFSAEVPLDNLDNYVVRLDRPEDGKMVLSLYIRSGDRVQVPVPAGAYSVRISHGQRWYGPEHLFGHATQTSKVLEQMVTTPAHGTGIEFRPGDLITVDASSRKFRFAVDHGPDQK